MGVEGIGGGTAPFGKGLKLDNPGKPFPVLESQSFHLASGHLPSHVVKGLDDIVLGHRWVCATDWGCGCW